MLLCILCWVLVLGIWYQLRFFCCQHALSVLGSQRVLVCRNHVRFSQFDLFPFWLSVCPVVVNDQHLMSRSWSVNALSVWSLCRTAACFVYCRLEAVGPVVCSTRFRCSRNRFAISESCTCSPRFLFSSALALYRFVYCCVSGLLVQAESLQRPPATTHALRRRQAHAHSLFSPLCLCSKHTSWQ